MIYVLKENNNHHSGVVKKQIGKINIWILKLWFVFKIILKFQRIYIIILVFKMVVNKL